MPSAAKASCILFSKVIASVLKMLPPQQHKVDVENGLVKPSVYYVKDVAPIANIVNNTHLGIIHSVCVRQSIDLSLMRKEHIFLTVKGFLSLTTTDIKTESLHTCKRDK